MYGTLFIGDHRLNQKSIEVDPNEIKQGKATHIIQHLFEKMELGLGVGFSAPQVGINKRILVFGMTIQHPHKPNVSSIPYTALINPVITFFSTEFEDDYETCLSIPNKIALVSRAKYIKYQAINVSGNTIYKEAQGFEARIIQHEVDHLDGVLLNNIAKTFENYNAFV